MLWLNDQRAFARAVRSPGCEVPDFLTQRACGGPALARFGVYRNNHMISLIDALRSRFGVTVAVTGDDFFREMARAFVLAHPPESPMLLDYGDRFGVFVASFAPAASLQFLGDLVRLEWAVGESYHAADAEPARIEDLGRIAGEGAFSIAVTLHPSLRLVSSPFPVLSIWSAHQIAEGAVDLSGIEAGAEYGVVVRPALKVEVLSVDRVVFEFLTRLLGGATLEAATDLSGIADQGELGGLLGYVFHAGLVSGVASGETA